MNANHHTPGLRPAHGDARFLPAFREPRRESGYSAAQGYYSQRRYTGTATTPLFRCS